MNGKQLKNSILQWAIQGKLVPQDPNDEPASVLLERIREEKARLLKEKKIKKDKNESIIYRGEDNSYYEKFLATGEMKCIDEEIPFEIPATWEWVRGKSVFLPMESTKPAKDFVYIDVDAVNNKTNSIDKPKFILKTNAPSRATRKLHKNDILFSMVRPYLRNIALVPEEYANAIASTGFYVITSLNALFPKYIFLLMLSSYVVDGLNSFMKGENSPSINNCHIEDFLYPLPPLTEQHRIVAKVEELLPFVENYACAQNKLNKLNTEINDKLKKSILQEAIQGRLVPQIAEEGTVQELFEQIKQEKARLVKEGKLKKSVLSDSNIFRGDDNKYYEQINGQAVQIECDCDFPYSWSLVRLSSICALIDGEKKEGQQLCLDAKFLRGKSTGEYQQRGKFVHKGDNIILVDGENSGEVFTVPCDGYMGSTFKQLWVSSAMHLPYVLNFILFYKELLRKSKRGAAIPHLNKEIFYSLIIGMPPYREQQRISARIDELSQLFK
ncbi:restriction endonuclease subunit S [Alistipes communis]|uniref:restriction endonuclease subunit S n=1 Tax=Alistipes communis TaxID=2585118 RepID=UPI0026DC86F1|nr:restriction endonuclease subunit S [Alistipes communis]